MWRGVGSTDRKTTPATTSTTPVRQLLGSANVEVTPQEHRLQRPTEHSDPTQHAKGRTGDCPGPRKETATLRNVTRGGGGGATLSRFEHKPAAPPPTAFDASLCTHAGVQQDYGRLRRVRCVWWCTAAVRSHVRGRPSYSRVAGGFMKTTRSCVLSWSPKRMSTRVCPWPCVAVAVWA